MADFTGILGTRNAQPGTLVPGKGPAGVTLETLVTVSQAIDFEIVQGNWQRLVQTVTVTPTISHSGSLISRAVTTTVIVAQDIVGLPQPYAYFTQDVLEVLYTTPGYARVTQEVLEVAYKKANAQSVSHTVNVSQSLIRSGDNSQPESHSVNVSQTIFARNDHIRQSVSHTVNVGQSIVRSGDVRQSLTHFVNVIPVIVVVSDHSQSVSHSINVNQTIAQRSTVSHQTVNEIATVAQTIGVKSSAVPEAVQHDIAVSQTIDFEIVSDGGPREVSMSVSHNIAVSQTCFGRNNVNRQSVTTSIGVSDGGADQEPNQHVTCPVVVDHSVIFVIISTHGRINDTILVTQSIGVRSTVVRLSVSDTVHVTPTLTVQELNISVSDTVSVTQTISEIDTTVELAVSQNIVVGSNVRWNPNSQRVTDTVVVVTHQTATTPSREIALTHSLFVVDSISTQSNRESVSDTITVNQSLRGNQSQQSVSHVVQLIDSYVSGNSNREMAGTDTVLVTPSIIARVNPNKQLVTHAISVVDIVAAQGPVTSKGLIHKIKVVGTATANPLRTQRVQQNVQVTQTIIGTSASNRQSVTDTIAVDTALRSSPKRVSVEQTVNVATRIARLDWTIKHNIHVTQAYGRIHEKSVTDTVTVTPALSRQVIFGKHVTDTLPITQSVIRRAVWYRSITQVLIIPDDYYLKQYSFWPSPIVLPAASGTLVTKEVKLSSKLGEIKLPAALLGNSTGNVDEVTIQRSMNSRTLVIIKSSDRQRLKLQFRVKSLKAREMMVFVKQSMSELITLTNWDAEVWIGRFTSNPFDMTNAGRWATTREFVTFEIEFEGTKVSG
jgi:hypothetical protein